MFKKGVKYNPTGIQGDLTSRMRGRPLDWLKQQCREIVNKRQLIEFLGDVASGVCVHEIEGPTGEKTGFKKTADIKDRLRAVEILLDRGFGRAEQQIDVTYDETNRPSTDALIQTIATIRKQLDHTRGGIEVEAIE